jgi:hypothetical protein
MLIKRLLDRWGWRVWEQSTQTDKGGGRKSVNTSPSAFFGELAQVRSPTCSGISAIRTRPHKAKWPTGMARRKSALTRPIQVWMTAIAVRVALQLHVKISVWIRDAAFHPVPTNT